MLEEENKNQKEKYEDILANVKEKDKSETDLETVLTFLTDNDVKPEELIKEVAIEKDSLQNNNSTVYDTNISSIDDLIGILEEKGYDFAMIEPNADGAKISFKKDQTVRETRNIRFYIYSNLLLQAKKISKLNLEVTTEEQKGSGEYKFKEKNLSIISRTVPSSFGEILYIKAKSVEATTEKRKNVKKITIGQAFGFLGAILFVALILGATFLTFIVFNAKTPSDVSFFANLGINLNDVNSFLLKVTTFTFSIVVLIETVISIILFFKGILTRKEFKRKKIILITSGAVVLVITLSTLTLWMTLDRVIKNLPNWQEMSYGNIQIYDNDLLNSNFDKSSALLLNYATVIGPINLKFDLKYLQKDEARRGFEIKKYIWDFGDGEKIETQTPEIVKSFDKKGNYKINLTLEGIDSRFPNKITSKPVSDMPEISVSYIIKMTENSLPNGGKTVSFDASELRPLGELEWYFKEDLTKPVFVGEYFQPSKVYFEKDAILMKIKGKSDESSSVNRIFIISGEKSEISGEIKEEASIDDDLSYTFRVEKLKNTSGAGFIKSFRWIIEDKEIVKEADILNPEESSKINHSFRNYGKQVVKVIITNTAGKFVELSKEINIQKRLRTKNLIEFLGEDNLKIENVRYNDETREYSLFEIGVPTKIIFDTKYITSDNPLYTLDEVSWDIGSDGSIDSKERVLEQNFDLPGFKEIIVNYKFVHRKDKNEFINIKDKIKLELVEKEANIVLNIKPDSEYVPTTVSFDASLSKVKNDNIVKFIYDYGDGIVEERDAINPGHKYTKEGNYKVKLTVITEKGNEYSIVRNLILKASPQEGKIRVSMKKAPVGQEIDFLSVGSIGQIASYHWDFGDGSTSNEANPSHAYSKPGKYKVVLTLEYTNNNVITLDTIVEITE